jgi:integrase/recombinase XerD
LTDPWVEGWLNEINEDTTRKAYERDIRIFLDWLARTYPEVDLPAVTRPMASMYAGYIRRRTSRSGQPLADSSRARMLSTVSSLYRYLVEAGETDANPFYEMKRPKVSRAGRTPARSDAEIARMWEVAEGWELLVLALLASSGLRVTELCRADIKNLTTDHEVRVLSVRTKGAGWRNVPLPPLILDMLAEHIGDRTTGALVLGRNGERIKRDHVAYMLVKVARRAGLSNPDTVRPHVLRASAITNLLERGRTTHDVQALVGHASADTTTRYWRRRAGIQRDLELVDDLIPEAMKNRPSSSPGGSC